MQPTLPAAPQEHGPLHDHPAAGDEVRNLLITPFLYKTVYQLKLTWPPFFKLQHPAAHQDAEPLHAQPSANGEVKFYNADS